MSKSGWIGVDLDGTLAEYETWRGVEHIGAPVQAMVERVQRWLKEGRTVKIFTARVSASADRDRMEVVHHIWNWCSMVGLPRLEVTNVKDFGMIELWDDRAVQVKLNTGEPVGFSPRGLA